MVGVTHDELRALCKAATPGPWGTHPDDPWEVQGNLAAYHGDDCEPVCTIRTDDAADATYIAAVSPDVVLGLLDEIARLKRTLRWYAQVGSAWRQQARAERDRRVADQCCTDYPTCTCRGKFL